MLTVNPSQNPEAPTFKAQHCTNQEELTESEEKIIRMRHGLTAADTMPIISLSQQYPELAKQLEDIEQQVRASATPQ